MKLLNVFFSLCIIISFVFACKNHENGTSQMHPRTYPYTDTIRYAMKFDSANTDIPVECYVRHLSKDSSVFIGKLFQVGKMKYKVESMDKNLLAILDK